MKAQLRHLVADALYVVKSYSLPSVCERYGMESGESREAHDSKRRYVLSRLEKLSDERVLDIARKVVDDYPDDKLQAAIEQIGQRGHLISDITRRNLAEALDAYSLSGKLALLELLEKYWPGLHQKPSTYKFEGSLADDIDRHAVRNNDWSNAEILENVGFLTCSQAKLLEFLEDVLQPVRRSQDEQEALAAAINPILLRDGYCFVVASQVSGYPIYKARETTATGIQPADKLISDVLLSFDESGVHEAWRKALDRRANDPEGAITAAKTLLETVCKHIIEGAGEGFGSNDDLPKLYGIAAKSLNLAPSQHTEDAFKAILGNCQAVVQNIATLRNRLGDSHGQGRQAVKPLPRHAELAVNLAGTMAMFLISTWNARRQQPVS